MKHLVRVDRNHVGVSRTTQWCEANHAIACKPLAPPGKRALRLCRKVVLCCRRGLECQRRGLECQRRELKCQRRELKCQRRELKCQRRELKCQPRELECQRRGRRCYRREPSWTPGRGRSWKGRGRSWKGRSRSWKVCRRSRRLFGPGWKLRGAFRIRRSLAESLVRASTTASSGARRSSSIARWPSLSRGVGHCHTQAFRTGPEKWTLRSRHTDDAGPNPLREGS